jgi:hypothetical protein
MNIILQILRSDLLLARPAQVLAIVFIFLIFGVAIFCSRMLSNILVRAFSRRVAAADRFHGSSSGPPQILNQPFPARSEDSAGHRREAATGRWRYAIAPPF